MIWVNGILVRDEEIELKAIRSPGPGGQNVNKVSTAIQLRFDVQGSPSLGSDVKLRLKKIAGKRMTRDGELVLTAHEERSQARNREIALKRFAELLRAALVRPKARRKTRPTLGSAERRMESKRRRSSIKALRQIQE